MWRPWWLKQKLSLGDKWLALSLCQVAHVTSGSLIYGHQLHYSANVTVQWITREELNADSNLYTYVAKVNRGVKADSRYLAVINEASLAHMVNLIRQLARAENLVTIILISTIRTPRESCQTMLIVIRRYQQYVQLEFLLPICLSATFSASNVS